jgi:small subunit ribosomal protein S20
MLTALPTSEDDIKPLEKLISEAYKEIDKAVSKDVLHKNNAARKKARIARWKRTVLLTAGLWVPPADHPDHGKYQRLQAKKAAAAQ